MYQIMVTLSHSQIKFMERRLFASLSIASPTTQLPLVTPVWLHYERNKFYIISNKATAKWRYIRDGQTKIGINVIDPKGWPYLSLNGKAEIIFEEDDNDFWGIIERIIRKYNSGEGIDQWLTKMRSASPEARRFLISLNPDSIYSSV